ncbi:MAG: TolC family protein [Candidatus Methylacidiphilales bacterium]|nr:TolC family protein [Candidatus Methylacidiphilales bacterium]
MKREIFNHCGKALSLLVLTMTVAGCTQRSNSEPDLQTEFHGVIQGYKSEADRMAAQDAKSYGNKDLPAVPSEFQPPSQQLVEKAIGGAGSTKYRLEELFASALRHSSQIRVFSDIPLIRETGIQEAKGIFDTNLFVEAAYDKINEPTGSVLTSGGPRLIQEETRVEAGVKKKFITGTEVTVTEKLAHTNSNSIYFTPDPQNTAEVTMRVVQPLLKGAGICYNTAVMRVAKIDSDIARQEFVRQTESHLLEISRSYWALHLARSLYFAKKRTVDDVGEILSDLEGRSDLDTVRTQTMRARASYEARKADLIRSEAAIRNAQDRLLALVNDPAMRERSTSEILTGNKPVTSEVRVDVRAAAATALASRPEISQGFSQLKAAMVREKMQRNEVLPTLNLLLEGTLSGLSGDNRRAEAWTNRFDEGGPGVMAGVRAEFPLENNEARARLQRRRLELRQQFNQLQTTVETVLLEVKVSVREVKTSYRDIQAKYASYQASKEEVDDLKARKSVILTSNDMTGATYLDSLLNAQDRLTGNEEEFLKSVATYNVALTNLQKSQGTLLSYESVRMQRTKDDQGLPQYNLEKIVPTKNGPVAPKSNGEPGKSAPTTPYGPVDAHVSLPAKNSGSAVARSNSSSGSKGKVAGPVAPKAPQAPEANKKTVATEETAAPSADESAPARKAASTHGKSNGSSTRSASTKLPAGPVLSQAD